MCLEGMCSSEGPDVEATLASWLISPWSLIVLWKATFFYTLNWKQIALTWKKKWREKNIFFFPFLVQWWTGFSSTFKHQMVINMPFSTSWRRKFWPIGLGDRKQDSIDNRMKKSLVNLVVHYVSIGTSPFSTLISFIWMLTYFCNGLVGLWAYKYSGMLCLEAAKAFSTQGALFGVSAVLLRWGWWLFFLGLDSCISNVWGVFLIVFSDGLNLGVTKLLFPPHRGLQCFNLWDQEPSILRSERNCKYI